MSDLKQLIHEAFNDVTRGEGISVREAIALDDWANEEQQRAARLEDVENHWWEIPDPWRDELGTALSFTNQQGVRFLLPAAMWADIDGSDRDIGHSIFFHLCLACYPYAEIPHHGHPEYVAYLRSRSPQQVADYFMLSSQQITAIAEFFKWWMQNTESFLYVDDRAKWISTLERSHEDYLKHARPGDYTLSRDDVIAIYDEECRILRDWLKLGGVSWERQA